MVREKFSEGRLTGQGGDLLYARIDGVMNEEGDFILMEIELIEPGMGFGYGESGKATLKALCDILVNTQSTLRDSRYLEINVNVEAVACIV